MANEFLADLLRRFQAIIAATANTFFPGIVDPDDPGPVFGPWQNVRNHVPYMPEWTDPAWSSTVEYSADGTKKRDIYVNTGTILRPAILPGDAAKNPTAFARRFGIYPKTRPDDEDPAVGKSLITPTTIGPSQAAADPFGDSESWQSFVFGGPTTKELIASGVYDPEYKFSGSVIEGDVHPWLSPADMDLRAWVTNPRWKLGSSEGAYDPADDRIWAAMQPALALAGRVLASNHPFW
ncbi:hypothetical protein F5883DRAFT_528780 [Diaporthe sp. PMI_573]|nr:hypothetical protein F5883DRAFT_528780 [Diaporthaceae sp. PMI_573]